MKEIAKALGLSEDASQQQVLAAIAEKDKTANETKNALVGQLLALGKKNGVVTDKNEAVGFCGFRVIRGNDIRSLGQETGR